jgi:diadenosine tetraphosphate (Ap4A) HIT family hydrolase
MQFPSECCLCSQIAGAPSNDLITRLLPDLPYARRVMLETSSFAVLPSLGPLVKGHSLLCPKAHVRSFASLDSRACEEAMVLKSHLKRALQDLYGTGVHLFEHGMAVKGDRALCSVEHGHLHFVPLPQSIRLEFSQDGWIPFGGSFGTLLQWSEGGEYIFYENSEGEGMLLLSEARHLPSQYMRKVVATANSHSDKWNWREEPDPLAADDTWRTFVNAGITGGELNA